MKFGIEVECVSGRASELDYHLRQAAVSNVSVEYDGSLPSSGRELKPQKPLGAHEVVPWVEGVLSSVKSAGFRASRSCGLHIHMDRVSIPAHVREKFAVALGAWAWAARTDHDAVDPRTFGSSLHRLRPGSYGKAPSLATLAYAATVGASHAFSDHSNAVSWSSHWTTLEMRMAEATMCSSRLLRTWHRLRLALYATRKGMLDAEYEAFVTVAQEAERPSYDRITPPHVACESYAIALAIALESAVHTLGRRMPLSRKVRRKKLTAMAAVMAADISGRPYMFDRYADYCGHRDRRNSGAGFMCTRPENHSGEHGAPDMAGASFPHAYTAEQLYWPNVAEQEGVLSA